MGARSTALASAPTTRFVEPPPRRHGWQIHVIVVDGARHDARPPRRDSTPSDRPAGNAAGLDAGLGAVGGHRRAVPAPALRGAAAHLATEAGARRRRSGAAQGAPSGAFAPE